MTGIKSIPAVFLDTQVFDSYGRDFQAANLQRLVRLCANGAIRLLITTVTDNEIRSHLHRDARDAIKLLRNYKRASAMVKKILPDTSKASYDEQSFRNVLLSEFDNFLRDCNAQLVSTADVSPERVLKDYFAGLPPFASGEKKSEFPDAFAIAAICNWSSKHECAVFAVSGDNDWRFALKRVERIRHFENLEILLEEFQDAETVAAIKEELNCCRDEIDQWIYEQASGLKYSLAEGICGGQIEATKIDHIKFGDVRIVDASNNTAIASIKCTVTIESTVTASYATEELTALDASNAKLSPRLRGNVVTDFDSNVLVYLKYTGLMPESISVERIEFETDEVVVSANEWTFDEIDDNDE